MGGSTSIRTASAPGRNALGYADHRPFTGSRSELVYGQQADGALVHIDHVPRGLACACVSLACGEVLIAYTFGGYYQLGAANLWRGTNDIPFAGWDD